MCRQYYHTTLSALFDEENDSMQMDDLLEQYNQEDGIVDHERDSQAYQAVMKNELRHHIDNMIRQQLTENEQSIVERYFGIGCSAHKPSRIAEDLGIREREVLAIVDESVRKLRECDYAIYLYQYLHGKRL